MSGRWADAVREIERKCPDLREIARVDVDDDGALTLTAACVGATRWFTYDEGGLRERTPERDRKVPLAATLPSPLATTSGWRVLSYRPERRMVVLVDDGAIREVRKGHRRGRSARAVARQRAAESAMQRGAFRVPALVRHDVGTETLVFEHLPVREVGLDSANASLYARLGERLAAFQRQPHAEMELFGPSEELAVLARWRAKVLAATDALPAGWKDAHARVVERAAQLPDPELGLAHRDLHDRQVHVDPARPSEVVLLDFDLLARADVALDPANLRAHLAWRAVQGLHGADAASARALERAFLGGLGRAREPGFDRRLAFYTATAFLRLALVYRLRSRWSARVGDLVARVDQALAPSATLG